MPARRNQGSAPANQAAGAYSLQCRMAARAGAHARCSGQLQVAAALEADAVPRRAAETPRAGAQLHLVAALVRARVRVQVGRQARLAAGAGARERGRAARGPARLRRAIAELPEARCPRRVAPPLQHRAHVQVVLAKGDELDKPKTLKWRMADSKQVQGTGHRALAGAMGQGRNVRQVAS